MKKIFLYIVICLVVAASPIVYFTVKNKIEENEFNSSWLVEIKIDELNVRKTADLYEFGPLGTVKRGEKYKILEINLDNEKYVWYKIEWNKREAWIASERNNPTVTEINNPNYTEGAYRIDYVKPEIKYTETTYHTDSMETITYDHLEIIEESEYEITSKVYIEDCPTYHQYWIVYTVVDSFGNKNSKTQNIVFDKTEPNKKEVGNLKEIRSNVCLEQLH